MATPEQRLRRRAQRDTAARVKAARQPHAKYQKVLPKSITEPYRKRLAAHAYDVMAGRAPAPAKGTLEARQLARLASLARHGKADPRFEAAFKQYWYNDKEEEEEEDEEE
jgi:hypothetical protein